uniref:Uncharacterized protein n=1 Tax=Globodera rostochiensis TaxID=31243 RepID=A0A914H4P2_GLORO
MILLKFWLLLIALLKAFGAHETKPPDKTWKTCENDLLILDKRCQNGFLICYQSKFAKDIGNLKAGGRFKVKNSPNKGFANECAGDDGTKGWHAVRISNDNTGIMTLDASFSSKPLIVNASKYAKINITKALTSDGQSVGLDFLKAIHLGAFMIDFDCMQFQIAALEIRQFIGKKDPKLCKTKCAAKWAPPKAHHVNHLGINCMQIEFPMGIPSFSLNISASTYGLACEESVEMLVCYRSKSQSTDHRNSILAKCQKHLGTASSNVAGIRVQICIHREAEQQILVVGSTIGFSFSEKIQNSTRQFSIKPVQTPETAQALTPVPFPFFFFEFGNERHSSFIADKAGGINTSSNWDKEKNAIIATVLNSIADVQINGSWTKTLHFVPPPNDTNNPPNGFAKIPQQSKQNSSIKMRRVGRRL